MIPNVVVSRSDSPLSGQNWTFAVIDTLVVLDSYTLWQRASKRHKEVPIQHYNRIFVRDSSIKLDDVPLPASVTAEALQKVQSLFRVVRELKR